MPAKKVAAVVTVYRRNSHADVILRNLLGGYPDGQGRPDLELVSVYTDQVPKGDLSRDLAKTHGFRIAESIADALTLGGKTLAVDAVLSIGEHGDYPTNDKSQRLYPRRRFFEEIAAVFEKTGKSVPVFNDKHLSAAWADAKAVYDLSRKRMVPFLAGSSVPVTWRRPEYQLPRGSELVGAVAVGYGPVEDYGFHALEGLQCMVERRKGGETGVKAVTFHGGQAMWDKVDRHPWAGPVLEEALKVVPVHSKLDVRAATAKSREPFTFEVEYRDGLRALVVAPNGWVGEGDGGGFTFAGQVKGEKPAACQFYLQNGDPFGHFAELVKAIDALARTGHAPYPVERTLLTTGVLDALMTSRFKRGERVETPYLDVRYQPTEWGFAKGPIPKLTKR